MRPNRILAAAVASVGLLGAPRARAQMPAGGIALDQLEPAPPGDTFFGVPSPFASGHLVPRAFVMFDSALRPLTLTAGATSSSVVAEQANLHVSVSFALWDRLLLSALFPIAVVQSGDSPTIQGIHFSSPSSAAAGDLRIGARVRLFGEYEGPFQIGVGGNVYAPTAPSGSFTGEGAVRVAPQVNLGGRVQRVVWSASLGAMFRASSSPATVTYGAGVGLLLLGDRLQVGPEAYAATPIQDGFIMLSENKAIARGRATNAELLLGVKGRLLGGLVLGAAAGPGLTDAIGTPQFRAVGTVAWAPLPARREVAVTKILDADGDGILDADDACSYAFGPKNADPKRNGCPVQDRDEDGVPDADDACPDLAGVSNQGLKRNGCPPDADDDGVPDAIDACPDQKGDAAANGCPLRSATEQALAAATGDSDGDGIPDADDACPHEKGAASADKAANGCPRLVRVTDTEIATLGPVKFRVLASDPAPLDPASEPLLAEVRDVLAQHPEILKIEVQAHTDDAGNADFNQKISTARAESVRAWLLAHGVAAEKLVAKGYGSSRPIADNKTVAGRAKNRRIAFVVLEKR